MPKIATWNVNSIRTRLDHVCHWLDTTGVDYLCLQETKVTDAEFPRQPFLDRGYQVYCSGQKAYNGVAILSRQPLAGVEAGFAPQLPSHSELDTQKRLIRAQLAPDVTLVNVYIPNGGEYDSEKYHYKLHWLKTLHVYLEQLTAQGEVILCGDFNIAPEDKDLFDASDRATKVGATDAERNLLAAIRDLGFHDAFRHFTEEPGHYSWWDYRAGAFRRNHGWRIDHLYITPAVKARACNCHIDIAPRRLPKPSDHAPVVLEIE
ncbi:exodeoxyribonuclease III [Thermosynechococcus sp. TG252]|uniref:exodeoxyribonuclease III n=1 Tax=Thermosynechococcus sp. TG252 TaxID=3074097 RepID=UPI00285EDC28|nr:exodeoxyribonuclease III [Thermosynechococcus sp. TG252]MDR7992775.1 exodeoxyribonuclease III [Thermosynechococcus sp. TG252]